MIFTISPYADFTFDHQNYLFHILNHFNAVEHFDTFKKVVECYRNGYAQAQVETFEDSDLVKSVRWGNVLTLKRKDPIKYSELECTHYNFKNQQERTLPIEFLSDANDALYAKGIFAVEPKNYENIRGFLAFVCRQEISKEYENIPNGNEIFEALVFNEEFDGRKNPIVFTLDEIHELNYYFVLQIFGSTLFDHDYLRLACYGVTNRLLTLNDGKNGLKEQAAQEVIYSYMRLLKKYELLGTNGENDKYKKALLAWEKDSIQKLILIRDCSLHAFDCLDREYFSLDRIILKKPYKYEELVNLLNTQIFSDRGIWKAFLKADPMDIYTLLRCIENSGSSLKHGNNQFVHVTAFFLQFFLRNQSKQFKPIQLMYLAKQLKYMPFMYRIIKTLRPINYAQANHLFSTLMGTMHVIREDVTPKKQLHWFDGFDESEFADTLDFLAEKEFISFDARPTVKSLIAHSKEWHRQATQMRTYVHPFSYPKIEYEIVNTRFEAIRNEDELRAEAIEMHHCIATYSQSMADKAYIAFRVFDGHSDWRGTVGLFLSSYISEDDPQDSYHVYRFNQIRGPHNSQAPTYMRMACESLIARLMTDQPLIKAEI